MNSKFFKFHPFRYLVFATAFVAVHSAQVWAAPNVQAESAILINARTGGVIYEKKADTRRSPASLTKVMTCILGLEEKGLDSVFNISMAAAATEYSDLGMKGGEKMRSGELMRGMMLESDNGAAVVVAQNVSGNILKFADRMNAKAKELGCRKTHFSNPHGLTAKWHYTTARDMAKIAAYAMKNPDFRNMVSSKSSVIHWASPSGKTYKADNTNRLLSFYTGANGIKTGWTSAAKGCLAASAKRNDIELIAIVLKSPDGDSRFADARSMLDYGFSVGGVGKIVVEKAGKPASQRVPSVKRPGASAPSVTNKPAAKSQPATAIPAVTNQPPAAAKQPASVIAPAAMNKPAGTAATTGTDTGAASAKPAVVSGKPVARGSGVRMPVVRRPGA
jgi:D-alanyl-D-alanine carboxypeptidase (penicillin-binding protein 5/6)